MEVESPVEVLSLEYVCDNCQRGRMRPVRDTGSSALAAPAVTYPHRCGECGHVAHLGKLYPDIIYRRAHATEALLN